jgi:hypothetical protein
MKSFCEALLEQDHISWNSTPMLNLFNFYLTIYINTFGHQIWIFQAIKNNWDNFSKIFCLILFLRFNHRSTIEDPGPYYTKKYAYSTKWFKYHNAQEVAQTLDSQSQIVLTQKNPKVYSNNIFLLLILFLNSKNASFGFFYPHYFKKQSEPLKNLLRCFAELMKKYNPK